MLADRAITPVGDQHGILERRSQHAVVIPALADGDVELQIHDGQDIPALDVLSGSPPPHPSMPGLRRHITQAPWRMEATLLVVIVYEQVPIRVKGSSAGVAHSTGVNAEAVVFQSIPENGPHAGVGKGFVVRADKEGPVPEMVRALAIPVEVRLRITHRDEEVPVRAELYRMQPLVIMSLRHAPDQLLRDQPLPFCDSPRDSVERRVGENQQVISNDLQVVKPGVRWEAKELLARGESPVGLALVHEEGFPGSDKQSSLQVHGVADEELLRVAVDHLDLQVVV